MPKKKSKSIFENDNKEIKIDTSSLLANNIMNRLIEKFYNGDFRNDIDNLENDYSSLDEENELINDFNIQKETNENPITLTVLNNMIKNHNAEKDRINRRIEKRSQKINKQLVNIPRKAIIEEINKEAIRTSIDLSDDLITPNIVSGRYKIVADEMKEGFSKFFSVGSDFTKRHELHKKKMINDLRKYTEKEKDNFYHESLTHKEAVRAYALSLKPEEIKYYLENKSLDIFRVRVDNPTLNTDSIPLENLGFSTNIKLFTDKIDRNNVFRYAEVLRGMKQVLDSKPWYKKIFSSTHTASVNALNQAIRSLVDKGVDKKALDKFINSSEKDFSKNFDKLMEKSEKNIAIYNDMNKDKLERNKNNQYKNLMDVKDPYRIIGRKATKIVAKEVIEDPALENLNNDKEVAFENKELQKELYGEIDDLEFDRSEIPFDEDAFKDEDDKNLFKEDKVKVVQNNEKESEIIEIINK